MVLTALGIGVAIATENPYIAYAAAFVVFSQVKGHDREGNLVFDNTDVMLLAAPGLRVLSYPFSATRYLVLASPLALPGSLSAAARIVQPLPGVFDVIVHGGPMGVAVQVSRGGRMITKWLDAKTVAKIIRANGWTEGQTVRLVSCETGAISEGFAQMLANELQTVVMGSPYKIVINLKNGAVGSMRTTYAGLEWVSENAGFIRFFPE